MIQVLGTVAIVLGGFVLATSLGSVVVQVLLRHVDRISEDEAATDEPEIDRVRLGLVQAQRQLPGGRWIGYLERAASYGSILAGFPAGLAIIVALKGVGRFQELDGEAAPRKRELFIIGTFASLLWAAACAGLVLFVLRFLF